MNKLKGLSVLLLFFLSWISLYWLTGYKTPWYYFSEYDNAKGISFHLGDIAVENYDRMGFTKALVQYVEPADSWLVGTERGEVFLLDNAGRQMWKRALGLGKFVSMALSKDGRVAYIGEQSPSGQLFALNAETGDLLWKYEASEAVGADAKMHSYPAVVHISVDKEDNVFINAYRFAMYRDGSRGYHARILSFSKKGELRWQYPQNEVMDTWTTWCDANGYNDGLVVSTSSYEVRPGMKYKDTLYFLNKQTGQLASPLAISPIAPYSKTVMRGSPNFSADGKLLAGSTSDGRAFLFDYSGKLLWERELSRPTLIDNSWINASGRDGYVYGDSVLFTTINTFNRENWQLPTPVDHPGSNGLFVFDVDGKFRYRYKGLGTIEQIAVADGIVACAVGRNIRTHEYAAHGGVIIRLKDGSEEAFFPTEGPLQAIALSADGKTAAGVEAPALTGEGKILGAYRFHLWRL